MATNIIYEDGNVLDLVCSAPATPASGGPVICGTLAGVALTNERADGKTSVKLNGVADLSVKGVDGNGNSAVALYDVIYYTDGDTPKLNKKTTGTRYGIALEAIDAGATATIKVRIGY